jgi:hypothetical protein
MGESLSFSYMGVSFETPQGVKGSVRSGNGEVYLFIQNLMLSFRPKDAKAIAADIIEAANHASDNEEPS